jgi:uncharacterized protein YegP (UPF0339 family)
MYRIVRSLVLPLTLAGVIGASALESASAQDKKKQAAGTSVFELYKDTADEFRFRLKSDDGVLLASSGKGYKTRAECLKVIDAIKSTAAKAKLEDISKK